MSVKRMDKVGIVVQDLDAAVADEVVEYKGIYREAARYYLLFEEGA